MSPKATLKSPSALSAPASYSKVTTTFSPLPLAKACPVIEALPVDVSSSLPTFTLIEIFSQAF